jgi:putative nucleotidyltransferase with HDIG domain
MPRSTAVTRPPGRDAVRAGPGGLLIGGVTLFLLPVIEGAFDITTSLTLIELRDPKQPLLRELQQRAPGTYNHSLNVASIAETAADAVGADGLMTYVGALYHDIGKMNKPEYFVENQSGGPSKHDKLSPAMSLLVIVGHVKDGMEIAREYGLPKVLRHFIEAHHGTTLVEYFYNRARKQAKQLDEADGGKPARAGEADHEDERLPEEVDYRYPGPKPRTKEVAILMLADAVESATRSLPEPTPSRIESLVHSLADKRLMDGQFDECDLTFRELRTIVDSLSKSVTSIYHGRIMYPGNEKQARPRTA